MNVMTPEEVARRSVLDALRLHDSLTPSEMAKLAHLLEPHVDYRYGSYLEMAVGILEDGDDDLLMEAANYLFTHLIDMGMLTTEEQFEHENAFREDYNELRRALGEEVDPDAPFEMPEIQGRPDQYGDS